MNKPVAQLFAVVAAVVGFVSFGATTYVWTGAEDGYWTNAANWTVGGAAATRCPGVMMSEVTRATSGGKDLTYYMSSTESAAHRGEAAQFGAVADGAATTIDLDGLFSIGSVVVKATAPAYTFGTAATQFLPIEASTSTGTTCGFLQLESGLETLPTMVATLSFGAYATATTSYGTLQNDTGREFALAGLGDIRYIDFDKTYGYLQTRFKGTGTYRIAGAGGSFTGSLVEPLHVFDIYASKVAITAENAANRTFAPIWHVQFYADAELNIAAGCTVSSRKGASSPDFYCADGSGRVTGEGLLRWYNFDATTPGNAQKVQLNGGYTLDLSVPFSIVPQSSTVTDTALYFTGGTSSHKGTLKLSGATPTLGGFVFCDPNRTLESDRIERFGDGPVEFRAAGTIACAVPTNATLAKTVKLLDGATGTVANKGGAELSVSPALDVTGATEFALAPSAGSPIRLSGVTVTRAEGATVTLVWPATGDADASLADGELAKFDALRLTGGSVTLPATVPVPLTFDTGATEVALTNGATVTLVSIARTAGRSGGTLNFETVSGYVRVTGATAATTVPSGVTVNGRPAGFTDDGFLVPAADRYVAARGDVIPNAAAATVGIVTEGSGGADAIAADATAVKALFQAAQAKATVAVGEGKSLTLGRAEIVHNGADLDLGAEGDLGTVDAPAKTLALSTDDAGRTLRVNAQLAEGVAVETHGSKSAPVLAGGSVSTNVVNVYRDELVLTGERPFALHNFSVGTNKSPAAVGVPTLRIDGARDVRLGTNACFVGNTLASPATARSFEGYNYVGRLVVTNSLVRNVDVDRTNYDTTLDTFWTDGAILLGRGCSGILEIQAGAVVSNRLIVGGCNWDKNPGRCLGTVLQTGGEMVALSSTTYHKGSCVGGAGDGYGHYRLDGGTLTILGDTMIGGTGYGFYHQRGGTLRVRALPNDATKTHRLYLGATNGGHGQMYIEGGTVECGAIPMCGAYYTQTGRACLALDGDAFLDTQGDSINLIGSGYSSSDLHEAVLSLNGQSRLRVYGVCQSFTPDATRGLTLGWRKSSLCFNGGTVIPSTTGRPLSGGGSNTAPVQHVLVFAGGAAVDTDGKTGSYIDNDLEGAAGQGVASVDISSLSIPDLPHAPYVDIDGDGTGAVAVAVWDSETWRVTGVKVVTPGVHYTTATARLRLLNVDGYRWDAPCTLAPNANTGSFTKKGEGDLTLKATNTWGGATIVAGGTLVIANDKSYPEGSTLKPQGGTLVVADGVTLPSPLAIDVSALDPEKRHYPVEFKGDEPTCPTVTLTGTGADAWRVKFANGKLRLSARRGLALVVQ